MLLTTQAAFAAGTKKVVVSGQSTSGAKWSVTSTISTNGAASGTGMLSVGTGRYPITITKLATGQGTITFSGKFSNGIPVTITAAVPNGKQTLSYVVNGQSVVLTGAGTVNIE